MRFPVAREGMSSQKAAEGKNQNVTGGQLKLKCANERMKQNCIKATLKTRNVTVTVSKCKKKLGAAWTPRGL
jgi:hypothetical protein